jgi:hypothetical protein
MKTKYVFMFLLFSITLFAQNQPRNQNVIAGEYFINQDPGEGRGTSLSSNAYGFGSVTINQTSSLSNNDALYIRFKSSNGKWSAPRSFKYRQPLPASGSLMQAGEYFVNNDPGYGKATGFNIGYDGKINLSSLKPTRNDKIFVRAKDSYGRWGDAVCVNYRYKNLVSAEYKIKFKGGSASAWQRLNIQNQTSSSAFFVALSDKITSQGTVDTVFIHFQGDDYVWGTVQKYAWKDITDVKEIKSNIPTEFSLSQNYPNPFNPSTKIKFDIPKQSHIRLVIYDILGREIEKLVNKEMLPGSYEEIFDGQHLSSGVYFYRIEAEGFVKSAKMVLMK